MRRLSSCSNTRRNRTDMQKRKTDIDWDELRLFLAVARAGQFLAAARRLDVDQATVTRRIRSLEDALGVRLFDRRTTGSPLTQAGERLVAHAERIEAEVLQAKGGLGDGDDGIEGVVRIGAPDGFGTLFLASRMVPLVTTHPALRVQLVPLPRSFSVARREVDLAVAIGRPTEGRLSIRKLTDYTLSLYASPDYLANAPPLRTVKDLARHRHVTYVTDLLYARTLDFRAELGLADVYEFQCASVLGQMEAVASDMGVALLHDYAVAGDARFVRVLPRVRFTRAYWLVAPAELARTPRVRAASDYLAQATSRERRRFVGGHP